MNLVNYNFRKLFLKIKLIIQKINQRILMFELLNLEKM